MMLYYTVILPKTSKNDFVGVANYKVGGVLKVGVTLGGGGTLGENELKFLVRLKIWGKSYILKNV